MLIPPIEPALRCVNLHIMAILTLSHVIFSVLRIILARTPPECVECLAQVAPLPILPSGSASQTAPAGLPSMLTAGPTSASKSVRLLSSPRTSTEPARLHA